ncbi:TetR/AcrR family transcriptional regulator C-terminal domain-containing protein [Solirubrobacter sp. CPCC 204708]|uniref:TetR/AcrR family transcriptional regulator C-terminal domain-containing protein n=1 Tax=Solirubrobacter deserti TaxID=2282478 RepID=A0ABT4RPW3_9ACTN|nr:TetR/AcrR family transcriptional regulator C-terminal domain-containing protein [Solirubrobacter deserti]MBE2318257.1 TetR/AcrR family transcriptional regulator C-terminal domain-containing protein [Solirubrobacter deserti]MDA0140595.1 TetR/AcrR family transcriptional regulator C-terminal domain-containing protein [Solirubrobacter deserti]
MRRAPLTRERVLAAALELADAGGLESLSMRKVATALGVEAMSLYNHVANKEDLVDGLVDLVFAEIDLPVPGAPDWKGEMRRRAVSVREVLNRHRWAVGLMESRMRPGPANLRSHNAVMGCLREAGFAFRAAVHASSLLDAYIYGFALQEASLPFDTAQDHAEVVEAKQAAVPDLTPFPYLVEVFTEMARAGYDYATEFAFGLDLILGALERAQTK